MLLMILPTYGRQMHVNIYIYIFQWRTLSHSDIWNHHTVTVIECRWYVGYLYQIYVNLRPKIFKFGTRFLPELHRQSFQDRCRGEWSGPCVRKAQPQREGLAWPGFARNPWMIWKVWLANVESKRVVKNYSCKPSGLGGSVSSAS